CMSVPMVKKFFDSLKEKDGPDFDVGRSDLEEIKRMGVFGKYCPDEDLRWIAPRNLAR
ncbi:MAG: hypothetical protein ACI8R4_004247, partial [Paracoccaceae bacterium]